MATTRRDLLRSTLLAAALPTLEPPDPSHRSAEDAAPLAGAGGGYRSTSFVDLEGWIIPVADRDALRAGAASRPPVEVGDPAAD